MSSTDKQTWYEVKRYESDPAKILGTITVLKETEHTITTEEVYDSGFSGKKTWVRRRNKDGDVFRTKVEAEAEITRRLTAGINHAQKDLDYAKAAFEKWFLRA